MDVKVNEQWFKEHGWTLTDVPIKNTIDGQPVSKLVDKDEEIASKIPV